MPGKGGIKTVSDISPGVSVTVQSITEASEDATVTLAPAKEVPDAAVIVGAWAGGCVGGGLGATVGLGVVVGVGVGEMGSATLEITHR